MKAVNEREVEDESVARVREDVQDDISGVLLYRILSSFVQWTGPLGLRHLTQRWGLGTR